MLSKKLTSKKRKANLAPEDCPRKYNFTFYRELFMGLLAVISVSSIIYELTFDVSEKTTDIIFVMDLSIALVFFSEYLWMLYHAEKRGRFVIKNWHLLLASIPIVDSWAEAFRALRLFEVVRVIRAEEHIEFSWHEFKRDNPGVLKNKR